MYQLTPKELESYNYESTDIVRRTISVGPLQCNCTVIGNKKTRSAIVIDPGDDVERILSTVKELDLEVKEVYHTHGHFDHILASSELKKKTGAKLCIHRDDERWWNGLEKQAKAFGFPGSISTPPKPDVLLDDGHKIEIEGLKGICIHTPGHTKGSTCYYFQDLNLIFTGDTLFKTNIGRTDLMDGNFEEIENSITKKLFNLPKETIVIPGHGSFTSIEFEKKHNLFFGGRENESGGPLNAFGKEDISKINNFSKCCCFEQNLSHL